MKRILLAYTGTDSIGEAVFALTSAAAVVLTTMYLLYF